MGNMSYVRFENTLRDLEDCHSNMDSTDELSANETEARLNLIELCRDIALEYGEEINFPIGGD